MKCGALGAATAARRCTLLEAVVSKG